MMASRNTVYSDSMKRTMNTYDLTSDSAHFEIEPRPNAKLTFARTAVKQELSRRQLEEVVRQWRAKQKLPPLSPVFAV